jgi:hypothetical protein
VEALISSPSFTYRTELGDGAAEAGADLRLAPHELASLLSFWLTDAPPDAALAGAAASGALLEAAELQRQVERLLGSEEARDGIVHTLLSAWGMSNLFGTVKDPALFPEYGPLLQSNMFEETRLFLNDALWGEGATLEGVVTSRSTFVNQALADLYGVPFPGNDPTSFVAVDLPAEERAGLLTQASLLTTRARTDNTSVVARGLFVRAAFLCLERPPPPPEAVIAQVQALLAADLTERERAEFRAVTTPCNSCHATIDGFGLMLEGYDAIGRHRTELEGEPIDTSVTLDTLGFPGTFSGAVVFADTLSSSPQFTACVARHLAVYATGDDAIEANDCELSEFLAMLPTEARLEDVITTLAASPLLQMRSGEDE